MRSLSPISLTILASAAVAVAGFEVSRRFTRLSDRADRGEIGRSALSTAICRVQQQLATHRHHIDRLREDVAEAKASPAQGTRGAP